MLLHAILAVVFSMMTSLCCSPASSQNLSEWVRCNLAHAVLDRLSKNCFIIINLLTSAQSTKHFAKIKKKKTTSIPPSQTNCSKSCFFVVCLFVGWFFVVVSLFCLFVVVFLYTHVLFFVSAQSLQNYRSH